MHHGPGIGLGVVIGGEGDGALGLRLDAVVVHEAHDPHGEALGRGDEPIGEGERRLARHRAGGGRRPEALELALGQRAENDDAVGIASGDGRGGISHRRRTAAVSATPLHVGEAPLGQPERRGQPRWVVAVVAV
jgi:hypothetical protein